MIYTTPYLGDFSEDSTITVPFSTHDKEGGVIAPSSPFEVEDIVVYKDANVLQKTTTNGMVMTSPFDSVVGYHVLTIDTSDDTGDAGFWVTGSDYTVLLKPDETVDGKTVTQVIAQFSIENRYPTLSDTKSTVGELLTTDVQALPGQAAPPLTPTLAEAITYLYKYFRNRKTQSDTTLSLYDDTGAVVDQKSAVTEAGGVTAVGEMESGP